MRTNGLYRPSQPATLVGLACFRLPEPYSYLASAMALNFWESTGAPRPRDSTMGLVIWLKGPRQAERSPRSCGVFALTALMALALAPNKKIHKSRMPNGTGNPGAEEASKPDQKKIFY